MPEIARARVVLGQKKTILQNNPPESRVIPKKIYHLTFVKQGGESFVASGDTFLTAIAFIQLIDI
ncbi:TPA: hypothetical protein MNM47_000113 [Raoultella ornithinolytica]|uniref:hypothetical protein n=1 Tax=Raoultella ornithinolytica TaxID=54291 RepID=UPI0015E37F68|nr:hypothetical protein [Raoultella ornithinolytica]HBZ9024439.1 hypothetical protein [Raoultella ornithinolytica]HCA0804823.1 hypothetical protein [Raoultella ornithinolytica]HCA1805505.1 hypothetical protein [Raoultella ornithinolytica]